MKFTHCTWSLHRAPVHAVVHIAPGLYIEHQYMQLQHCTWSLHRAPVHAVTCCSCSTQSTSTCSPSCCNWPNTEHKYVQQSLRDIPNEGTCLELCLTCSLFYLILCYCSVKQLLNLKELSVYVCACVCLICCGLDQQSRCCCRGFPSPAGSEVGILIASTKTATKSSRNALVL